MFESVLDFKYISNHNRAMTTDRQVQKIFSKLYIWHDCRAVNHYRVPTTHINLQVDGNTHMIRHVILSEKQHTKMTMTIYETGQQTTYVQVIPSNITELQREN